MQKTLNVLELFAGSRSIGKEAEKLGMNVFSVDIENFDNIDLVIDILDLEYNMIPFKPDIIWASPPCTAFSVCTIGKNWNHDHTPKSDKAIHGMEMVEKTIQIIKDLKPKYWFIENPRGKLRKLQLMTGLPRTTIWYCKYGDTRAKPTDIWTNNLRNIFNIYGWEPRPRCFKSNKNCHHDKIPRGYHAKVKVGATNKGTQGLSNNYERSKIPEKLCKEIMMSCLHASHNI